MRRRANDLDANLADILMVGDKSLGPGVDRAAFTKLFEADRAEADHDLRLAALHAGANGIGAQQVGAALNALGDYEALAGAGDVRRHRRRLHFPIDRLVIVCADFSCLVLWVLYCR